MDDESKAAWRRQFMPMLHPYLPEMATLIETANKLDGIRSFIDSLSPDVEAQRDEGVFVGSLAIRYGLKILDHFGLVDGDDAPTPTHLDQVKNALANVIATIQKDIHFVRTELSGSEAIEEDLSHDEVSGIDDAARRDADALAVVDAVLREVTEPNQAEDKFVIDRETFSVRCGGKSCSLGNTKEFQLLERLHQARKTFLPIGVLMNDVWPDSEPEKNTVQKTVGNLRKRLRTAGLGEYFTIKAERDHYQLVIH